MQVRDPKGAQPLWWGAGVKPLGQNGEGGKEHPVDGLRCR